MADYKDYISRSDEHGTIHISEEVLAVIAAAATLEVEGVGGLAANFGSDLAELFTARKNMAKGINISVEEEAITIHVAILVKYGFAITDVAKVVQEGIATAIESTSGFSVAAVHVQVAGIAFEKESKKV